MGGRSCDADRLAESESPARWALAESVSGGEFICFNIRFKVFLALARERFVGEPRARFSITKDSGLVFSVCFTSIKLSHG